MARLEKGICSSLRVTGLWMLTFVAVFSSPAVYAQQPTSLSISIQTGASKIQLLEPLPISVEIANRTGNPLTIETTGLVGLQIWGPAHGQWQLYPQVANSYSPPATSKVQFPNGYVKSTLKLVSVWPDRTPVFSKPGSYRFRAGTQVGRTVLWSDPVTAVVSQPTPAETTVIDEITSGGIPLYLAPNDAIWFTKAWNVRSDYPNPLKIQKGIDNILARHPNSSYASRLRLTSLLIQHTQGLQGREIAQIFKNDPARQEEVTRDFGAEYTALLTIAAIGEQYQPAYIVKELEKLAIALLPTSSEVAAQALFQAAILTASTKDYVKADEYVKQVLEVSHDPVFKQEAAAAHQRYVVMGVGKMIDVVDQAYQQLVKDGYNVDEIFRSVKVNQLDHYQSYIKRLAELNELRINGKLTREQYDNERASHLIDFVKRNATKG